MMKLFNVVLRDSVVPNPFAPSRCCDSALASSAVGAGANILGNLLGLSSNTSSNQTNLEIARMNQQAQRETNLANREIAREANNMNYRMFQEQNAYNLDMWNKNNAYNSMSAQVERMKAAGINPYFGLGNSATSNPVSAADSAPAQTAEMRAPFLDYNQNPYNFDFNGVGSAANAFYQNQLLDAQKQKTLSESNLADQSYRENEESWSQRLKFLQNTAKREDYLGEIAREQLSYEQLSKQYRLASLRNDVTLQQQSLSNMKEQNLGYQLQNRLYEVQIAYAPKLNDANLKVYYETVNQLKAQIGLINANKLLTDEQRLHEVEKRASTVIDNGLKGLDFKIKDAVKSTIIDTYKEDLYFKQDSRYFMPFDKSYQYTGKAGQYFPYAQGSYGASEVYRRNVRRDRLK